MRRPLTSMSMKYFDWIFAVSQVSDGSTPPAVPVSRSARGSGPRAAVSRLGSASVRSRSSTRVTPSVVRAMRTASAWSSALSTSLSRVTTPEL